ncbi:MAG: hypothetical protein ABS46_00080 [Cytophagaceae bacterium SCN 52-12]|nr:MAG: hypothetical protein ABS46_00080 [Cytophagaceae bacterium SCN 52-12]
MFRSILILAAVLFCRQAVYSQTDQHQHPHAASADTFTLQELREVVVISQRSASDRSGKPLASLDTYLEKSAAVNMIRRGSYAWEPYLNGMASERSVITIDGMRIYAACTDKMDPVTSYVETTNLASATVHNGPSGSTGGATVAGSLDLVRKKGSFGRGGFNSSIFGGFEANNRLKTGGTGVAYSGETFFANADVTYRHADNYRAGGGTEIRNSGFSKLNMSAIAGYKADEHRHLEASLIFDRASDVGYPALPMDVSLAQAYIASLEYIQHHLSPGVSEWKTKLYYNNVRHVMDDSRRPDVPIRMDMPGWSRTWGFYSQLKGSREKHDWKASLSGHHNHSLAEMTMYSDTPGWKDMYMLTWPGVATRYADLYAEDSYSFREKWKATTTAGLAVHNNLIDNITGLGSLRIFYPGLQKNRTRLLKRLSSALTRETERWLLSAAAGYGERAPGISEGYGYYLFNSFDRFDYIGNPEMRNEKTVTYGAVAAYRRSRLSAKLSGSVFQVYDYIIGKPDAGLSAMTIGAAGVKVYEQLRHARIMTGALEVSYQFGKNWLWTSKAGYRNGKGNGVGPLPLMQPFSYQEALSFTHKSFSADASIGGALKQTRFNPAFGESPLPAYAVLNLSASQLLEFGDRSLTLKAGAENLLDQNYTTFADWNRLPRMGRNIFMNVIWKF